MRILFISDIHGVKTNLDVIKNYEYDTLVILGDLYHNGYEDSNEFDNAYIKDFIMNNRSKIICTKGNCDNSYDFIDLNLPVNDDYIKITDDGLNIYCSHGHRYNYRNLSYLGTAGVIIYGHEHVPSINNFNDVTYICVGSISKPRYGSLPSFCIYEDKKFTIYAVTGKVIDSIAIKKHF